MCSIENQQQASRQSNNRLNLTVTPAFPILISSDIVIIKENANIQVSRSRTSSILDAEELGPENQAKVFASENPIWDRLSLISSTESVNSTLEGGCGEKCNQPLEQEKNCLLLSDWLIRSMEERHWREWTEGIDFMDPVDPALYLQSADPSSNFGGDPNIGAGIGECSSSAALQLLLEDYQREEGNSVFYANSQFNTTAGCSHMASTSSRIYEVADSSSAQSSPRSIDRGLSHRRKSSQSRRRSDDGTIGRSEEERGMRTMSPLGGGSTQEKSVQELISSLADTATFHNSQKRVELLRTFNMPTLEMSHRNWRPPKKKFIFELQKPNDFLTQLVLQKHRCTGCGLKLDKVYARRAQFCNYFSKLFCQCCHQGAKARIPARILHDWNFKEYLVSDIAHKFLTENEDQPVFNVKLINPGLYKKARNLRRFRKLRLKIAHMWPFVQTCRLADQLMTEHGILRTMFTSAPKRFLSLESIDVYSLLDFERIANKNLLELLEPLVLMGTAHIEGCLYCRQHAFFCQLCMDPCDLLFPFQLDRCHRCDGCGSLSHIKCLKTTAAKAASPADGIGGGGARGGQPIRCEKCERIRKKKLRLQRSVSSEHSACNSE